MKKVIIILGAFAVLAAGGAFAAVEAGENLLINGALEADQADMPPYWVVRQQKNTTWSPSGGPDGRPCVTLKSDGSSSEEMSFRQYGLRLAEGGRYRISAYVRTAAFSVKRSAGVCLVNNFWKKSAGVGKIPSDTAGKWVKMEQEFTCFASDNGAYSFVVYASGLKGEMSVADLKLVAIDALALEKSERSPLVAAQSQPQLIPFSPVLGRIPRYDPSVEFRFFGKLPDGGAPADFDVTVSREGTAAVSRAPLAAKSTRLVLPDAATATQGVFTVAIVRRADGKRVFEERHRYAVRDVPRTLMKGRRLNNFAFELVAAEHRGEGVTEFPFDAFRDGWLFIKAGNGGGNVALDGTEVVSSATPRGETFRLVEAGRHRISVSGAPCAVTVRAIADIFNYCPGANSHVKENGPYDWAFQEKYVLPAVTTQNGGSIPKDRLDGFLARGYRWLSNLGTTGISADGLVEKLGTASGMVKPGYAGVTCDEQFFHSPNAIDDFARGMAAYDLKANPSRAIYTWIVGKPATSAIDERFFATAVNVSLGAGRLLFEAYCRTKATEDEARRYLNDYITDTIARYRVTYPLAVESTCIALGNFNQVPILSLAHHPEVDYKYYIDMQLNMIANDPTFEGLGSIGYWGSYYADEELHRWCFALMRHYVVEGRKDMLSSEYGFSYRPDHILNGDFRGTLEHWRTEGGVRADVMQDFAKNSENRWGGNGGVGDTFAVLVRGKDSAATLRQTAKGLEPGRMYRLRYTTFDVKDVKAKRTAPRRFGVSASVGAGAEVEPSLTWTHVDRRAKGRYGQLGARVNLGQIVFKASAPEVEVAFSNEAAAEGEELGVHYVSILPYYPAK